MGDFYELFFEDAEVAARALGIVLTKRGKHLGRDIPMCGVPIHRSDEYLHRLIALGHRVAVCEQLEDPAEARKRGGKSVVRRDVVRLVTPGTLTEDTLLDARRNNYLLAIARTRASADEFALAWIDISTGEFRIAERDRAGIAAEIARLEPGEIIVSDALYGDTELAPYLRSLPAVTPLPATCSTAPPPSGGSRIISRSPPVDAFGALSRLELTAAAACVTYVERTQLGKRPPLSPPMREAQGATLLIDQATRSNLELVRTLAGERARLAARRDRPHRDGGGLAAAGAAARRAAHRSAGDRARGSMRSRISSPMRPRARDVRAQTQGRARSRPRAGAAGGRPRRSARSCRHPRRHAGGRRARRRAGAGRRARRPSWRTRPPRCAVPIRPSPMRSRRRSPTSCRCSSATAASCAPATTPRSTRRARCATNRAG